MSSTTSFVAELLVSVLDFKQTEFEENWTEVFAPPVPTQRSVAFLGLSFFRPLQTSHTGDVIVSGRQSYMCVVRNGGDTDMRKCDANLRARDSHGGNRRARGRGKGVDTRTRNFGGSGCAGRGGGGDYDVRLQRKSK